MTDEEIRRINQKIAAGGKVAVAEALERHRRLGESFGFAVLQRLAIRQDGKVVILEADQIPPITEGQAMVE